MRLDNLFEGQRIVLEKRRNAPNNPKTSLLGELRKYAGRKDIFVSFTDDVGVVSHNKSSQTEKDTYHHSHGVRSSSHNHNLRGSKLGINPRSSFETPLGIYTYPVDYILSRKGQAEFGGNRPYVYVVQSRGKLLDLDNYTEADLAADIKKLDASFHMVSAARESAKINTPGCIIWNLTRLMAKEEADEYNWSFDDDEEEQPIEPYRDDYSDDDEGEDEYEQALEAYEEEMREWSDAHESREPKERRKPMIAWMSMLSRRLGYEGAVDYNGGGIIHENEPTQAVFFGRQAFKELEVIHNRSEPKEPRSNYAIWDEKPHIFANLLAKGRIPADEIIGFFKQSYNIDKVMDAIGGFKKLPVVIQTYMRKHPEEFISEFNYQITRYIPMTDKVVLSLLQKQPSIVTAMPKLSKPVQNYIMTNYKSFPKDVIGNLYHGPKGPRLPDSFFVNLILNDHAAWASRLPKTPKLLSPEVMSAIIKADPSAFMPILSYITRDQMQPSGLSPAIWVQYYKAAFGQKDSNKYARQMFVENLIRNGIYDGFSVCVKLMSKADAANLLKAWMRGSLYSDPKIEKIILAARPDLRDYYERLGGEETGIS